MARPSALQRYLKPLLKGRAPKAVLFLWATAPLEDVITQQIPIYLQIWYPAGAICLSVVTYHPACSVSSLLGLLVSRVVLWPAHYTAHHHDLRDGKLAGKCPGTAWAPTSTAPILSWACSAQVHQTVTDAQLLQNSRPELILFYQQQNN